MHLVGWQNTREQAPGVPATPSRPDGGGQPWPCTCVHGPKKSSQSMSANYGASTVYCTSGPHAPVFAKRRAMNQVQDRERKLHDFCTVWTSTGTCRHKNNGRVNNLQELHQQQLRNLHSFRHCPTPSNCLRTQQACQTCPRTAPVGTKDWSGHSLHCAYLSLLPNRDRKLTQQVSTVVPNSPEYGNISGKLSQKLHVTVLFRRRKGKSGCQKRGAHTLSGHLRNHHHKRRRGKRW